MYEQTWTRLMHSQQQFTLEEYLERSLLTTWVLSYEQVIRESPAAAGVLRLWAYFGSGDLWFDLLAVLCAKALEMRWPMWYSSLVRDELTFHDRMNVPLAYSLASISANGQGYSMHQVVHDWTRHQVGGPNERSELYRMAIYLVGARMENPDVELERRLLPHARHQAKHIQAGGDEQVVRSLNFIAKLLDDWHESVLSSRLYEHILAVCRTTLGPDHDWTLRTISIAADVNAKAGSGAQASVLYKRAYEGYKALCGEKNEDTLDTCHRWAVFCRDCGRLPSARQLYEDTLDGYLEIYGKMHEKTYLIAFDMAKACYEHDPERAETLLRLSLKGKRHCLAETHWMTVENLYQLGWNLYSQRSTDDAVRAWQSALEVSVAEESVQKWMETTYVVPVLWRLSTIHDARRSLEDAEQTLLRLRRTIAFRYGLGREAIMAPIGLLSWSYRQQTKLAEAEEAITDLLDLHAENFGSGNQDLNNMPLELAIVRLRRGKLTEALQSLNNATVVADTAISKTRHHIQHSVGESSACWLDWRITDAAE